MKSICIIPARGGSKRIPRKNIKEFCGKPIIAYSIQAALGTGIFDEVMVSTDNEEIVEIAKSFGASVPFLRSDDTSNDYATTEDVLKEVLKKYKEMGHRFDYCCCLYATAPFVTSNILTSAFSSVNGSEYNSVVPIVRYSHPVQRAFVVKDNFLEYKNPEYMTARTQDLQVMYHDSGQFYIFNVPIFLETGVVITDRTYGIEIRESQVRDIDSFEDWKIAEVLYKCINSD